MSTLELLSEYLTADAAFDGALMKEDSVRDASMELDRELLELLDHFNILDDPDAWSFTFGTRLADLNVSYGKKVRERLRLISHNLRMVHALPFSSSEDSSDEASVSDVPGGGAINMLVSLISQALRNTDTVANLLEKFDDIHVALESCNALTPPDRVFIHQTKPNIEACVRQLKTDAATVKDKFRTYKRCFYLLSDETALNQSLRTLRGSIISAERFEKLARSAFATLRKMRETRQTALKDAEELGIRQGLAWFEMEDEQVPRVAYEQALTEYDPFLAVIRSQKSKHGRMMQQLEQIHRLAQTHPSTIIIPGTTGEEINVGLAYDTFNEYEVTAKMCCEMIESSTPLIQTLNEYIAELKKVVAVE